jgi:hypothetical protein
MATVVEENDYLVLKLSLMEKMGSFHPSIRISKSELISVSEVQNPWAPTKGMRGLRAPGTGIPWVIILGTLRYKGGKDFAAVYGRGPAKVYEFKSGSFRRWIVSTRTKD